MSAGRRRIIQLALVTVVMLAGGSYLYWRLLIRSPFAGATFHDFGEVAIFGETEKVQHTFHLTNRLTRPMTIVAIRPECGCLTTKRDARMTLQPGESFDLPITLEAKAGVRVVPIDVLFDDDSMTTLRVRATGRYMPQFHVQRTTMPVAPDGSADIAFELWTFDAYDAPAKPVLTSVAPAAVEFSDWVLRHRPPAADIDIAPTIWTGRAKVRLTDPKWIENPEPATITIDLAPARPLTITLDPQASASTESPAASLPADR